jgi:beta-galactosidase
VTRNKFGAGEGWYIATHLDQAGVAWVMRRVLDRHGLTGPYPSVAGLETAERVTPDGTRLTFLLNHGDDPLELTAHADATELLSAARLTKGDPIRLEPRGVMILAQ